MPSSARPGRRREARQRRERVMDRASLPRAATVMGCPRVRGWGWPYYAFLETPCGSGREAAAFSAKRSRIRAGGPATCASGVEKRDHREHAAVIFRARRQSELRKDARHVLLDRTCRHDELLRDRLVRSPLSHQLEHLPLARGQRVERVVAAPSSY